MITLTKWILFSIVLIAFSTVILKSNASVVNYEWLLISSTNEVLKNSVLAKGYRPSKMRFQYTAIPFIYKWSTGSFCNDAYGQCIILPIGFIKSFGQFSWHCMGCENLTKHMISNETGCGDIIADILLKADKLKSRGKDSISIFAKEVEMNYVGFPNTFQ